VAQLDIKLFITCLSAAALPHLLRTADRGPRQVAGMVNISSVAGRAARNGNGSTRWPSLASARSASPFARK
jgi:hypothetical protein